MHARRDTRELSPSYSQAQGGLTVNLQFGGADMHAMNVAFEVAVQVAPMNAEPVQDAASSEGSVDEDVVMLDAEESAKLVEEWQQGLLTYPGAVGLDNDLYMSAMELYYDEVLLQDTNTSTDTSTDSDSDTDSDLSFLRHEDFVDEDLSDQVQEHLKEELLMDGNWTCQGLDRKAVLKKRAQRVLTWDALVLEAEDEDEDTDEGESTGSTGTLW